MKNQFLEAGKIVGTKGLRGELMIECWCDEPNVITSQKLVYMDKAKSQYKVISGRIHKKSAIIQLEGINSIEEADAVRGKIIYIDRNTIKLEKGQYFIQDLIGVEVFDVDTDEKYGTITNVYKTGANDVYEITSEQDKQYLIPVIDDVIIKMDIEQKTLKIKPLKGIFDAEV